MSRGRTFNHSHWQLCEALQASKEFSEFTDIWPYQLNEVAKFMLGELQKEHYRARLAAETAQAEQLQDGGQEEQPPGAYNGFTLLLKDRLQSMAS